MNSASHELRKNSMNSAQSVRVGYEVALHHSRFDIIKSKLDDTYEEKENKYYMDKIPNLQAPIPPEFQAPKESLYANPKVKNMEDKESEEDQAPEVVYEKY